MDLADLKEVKNLAIHLSQEYSWIDLIICNAGVMMHPFALTVDNFESHYAVNLLSHAVLVNGLLPSLVDKSVRESRIVFVSSVTAHLGDFYSTPVDSPQFFTRYINGYVAYATSKLAVSLYAEEMSRKLKEKQAYSGVTIISVHPGCVASRLYQYVNPWSKFLIFGILKYVLRTPVVAAAEVVVLGCNDNLQSGCYYQHMIPAENLHNTSEQQRHQLYQRVQNIIKSI